MNTINESKQKDYIAQGSPEWFWEKAQTEEMLREQINAEKLREHFIEKFSPEKLFSMNEDELLNNIFGTDLSSMISVLTYSSTDYQCFGVNGYNRNLGIIYQTFGSKQWYYWDGKKTEISRQEAERKAVIVRDLLLKCVKKIEKLGEFHTIQEYKKLQKSFDEVFFSRYVPYLTYFQLLFPQYFPCIYSDEKIERVIRILGLPWQSKSNRIVNIGRISLFIRQCDINNVVFNRIFEDEWGWEGAFQKCQNANANGAVPQSPIINELSNLYGTSAIKVAEIQRRNIKEAIALDNEIDLLNINGEEREVVVKARVNQGVFRESLLEKYNCCCLCGVSNKSLLIASHIKPWKASESNEKLKVDNGLLLCPDHDKLFDKGFISFEESGKIMISEELSDSDAALMCVSENMKITLTTGQRFFLKYHRNKVFRKPKQELKEHKV